VSAKIDPFAMGAVKLKGKHENNPLSFFVSSKFPAFVFPLHEHVDTSEFSNPDLR